MVNDLIYPYIVKSFVFTYDIKINHFLSLQLMLLTFFLKETHCYLIIIRGDLFQVTISL